MRRYNSYTDIIDALKRGEKFKMENEKGIYELRSASIPGFFELSFTGILCVFQESNLLLIKDYDKKYAESHSIFWGQFNFV